MSTLAFLRIGYFVACSVLLAPAALAAESVPPPQLAAAGPATSTPLVLGAPPAWTVMALGATVISLTVLRRVRKHAPARARRD